MSNDQNIQRDGLALDVMNAYYEASDGSGSRHWGEMANILTAAGYRKPRTITTVSELNRLADGSVVLDLDGDVGRRVLGGWTTTVVEADGGMWLTDNTEVIALPATVLHEPGAAA